MTAKAITDAFVRNVRPPRKFDRPNQALYLHTLERGLALALCVSYGGSRTFRVVTYRNGKPQSRKLGTYPQMTVKMAREQARQYWLDPGKFEARSEIGSFKEIAANWLKRHVEHNKLRSQREIERILDRYVYPRWANTPFLEIRRKEVNLLLDHVADHNGRAMADQVLSVVRSIMGWHQSRDENYSTPIVRGMQRNANGKARERILDDDEIRVFWAAAGECGAFGGLVRLCLLTAQRREKIGTMRWDDLADGVWTIASEAREKGNAGQLKLPQVALDIIAAQPRFVGNPYIFPSRRGGHFVSWGYSKSLLDRKLPAKMPEWRVHDLRRSARSLMSRADVRPDVAERVLGHAIPGVQGIYNRHQYFAEKADALQRLAALVGTIINPPQDNVVAIAGKRRSRRSK
jgi:integrase